VRLPSYNYTVVNCYPRVRAKTATHKAGEIMALYKYAQFLTQDTGVAFDQTHGPGQRVPYSGIYRCENCARQIAANQHDPFPPQNHHQHNPPKPILWRLTVAAH